MAPVALSQTLPVSEHPSTSTSTSSTPLKHNGVNGASNKSTMNGTSFPSPDPTYPTLRTPVPRTEFSFDAMEDALAAFARGEFLVVMDDEDRENEGDLIAAASMCSTEKMAWMIRHTSGYICIGLPGERLDELDIPMMVPDNQERHRTAYTVTVDYRHGTTTGISAHDRALTARSLVSASSTTTTSSSSSSPTAKKITKDDFARPGHMVPLRARPGGVCERKGHTEAAVDLCRMAGLKEVGGVLCELVNDDREGSMARRDDCRAFADRWGLRMVSVEMLRAWRVSKEKGGE